MRRAAIANRLPLATQFFGRYKPGIADVAVIGALLTLLLLQLTGIADDPGLGWHLKSGEMMLAQGRIPTTDPFLFSPQPRPWVADEWLGSVIFAYLYQHGGWAVVYAFCIITMLLIFFGPLLAVARKASGSAVSSAFAAFIAFKISTLHFLVRPVLPSLLLFSLEAAIGFNFYLDLRAGRSPKLVPLLALPPLFVLGSALHPYFVLGFALFGLIIAGIACDAAVSRAYSIQRKVFAQLILILILSFAATLINPYGLDLYKNIARLGTSGYFTNLLSEWRSIDFKSPEGNFLELLAGLLLIAVAVRSPRKLGWGFVELFVFGAFLHEALRSIRFVPLFAIVTLPALAQSIAGIVSLEWFDRFPMLRQLKPAESGGEVMLQGGPWLSLTVITAMLFYSAISHQAIPGYSGPLGPTESKFPFAALHFLKNAPDPKPIPITADLNWAGFVEWQGWPDLKPLIDDRLPLQPEAAYREFLEAMQPGGDIRKYMAAHDARYLLIGARSPAGKILESNGELQKVHEDEIAVIFKLK